jgi:hypothetical protein
MSSDRALFEREGYRVLFQSDVNIPVKKLVNGLRLMSQRVKDIHFRTKRLKSN